MTVKYYKEITEWAGDTPNHTYLIDNVVSKDKIVGYIKQGTNDIITFDKPLKFFRGYRKFKISAKFIPV